MPTQGTMQISGLELAAIEMAVENWRVGLEKLTHHEDEEMCKMADSLLSWVEMAERAIAGAEMEEI